TGSRTHGAKKILIKHAGLEKTGGVSHEELLDIMKPVRQGELTPQSFSKHNDFVRYAYDFTDENSIILRLVVEEHNDGKKIFDFYSDRNFTPKTQELTQAPQENTYKSIFEQAKAQKAAKEQERLAKQQADSEFIAQREAKKQARIDKILEMQKASQGQTTLEARAKIKAEQMGEPIPYQKIADTHIILEDITYPAEFVIINKNDLKPSFEAGGFQTREVKQEDKIANIRDNFDPLKIFGKIGEYDGLPIIAKNGEIIAGNHRGEAIKNLSGENLAKYQNEAKKVFGIDLEQDKIIVRRILDDTENENG
ncbi:DUF3519 domain-containing protein, partial [Helicobacter sp. T3_23-1059]